MNSQQNVGLILIIVSLGLLFSDKFKHGISTPTHPVNEALVNDLRSVMSGSTASEDAQNLGRCLIAVSNLITLDSQRQEPFYKTQDSIKSAVKNVGDLSYPLGWKMSDKYPGLPSKIGGWLQSQLGEKPDKNKTVEKFKELGYALMEL